MADIIEEAFDVGFYDVPKDAILQLERQIAHRILGASQWPVAV